MLELIDTHCHLHDNSWYSPEAADAALAAASAAGVAKIICIGTNHADSLAAAKFASEHAGVYCTYGIHPEFAAAAPLNLEDAPVATDAAAPSVSAAASLTSVTPSATTATSLASAASLSSIISQAPFVAIGEIGLDYHYSPETRPAQIHLLEQMLQLARELDLPVSLHVREAFRDMFPILDNFPEVKGVIHSFTGSKRDLSTALNRGFFIGVNGLATYTTVPLPPLERMLLETDAPFLTPEPIRGKMNTPANVRLVAKYLAAHLGITEEIIAERTTENGKQLFHI